MTSYTTLVADPPWPTLGPGGSTSPREAALSADAARADQAARFQELMDSNELPSRR